MIDKTGVCQPVSVQLPADLLPLLGPTPAEVAARLSQLALIDLFRRGEVSSGYAAQVLGMSKADFIELLAKHDVPYLDLSEEELRRDVEVARSHWGSGKAPPSQTADR